MGKCKFAKERFNACKKMHLIPGQRFFALSKGVEPSLSEPESEVLSIKLRKQNFVNMVLQRYEKSANNI